MTALVYDFSHLTHWPLLQRAVRRGSPALFLLLDITACALPQALLKTPLLIVSCYGKGRFNFITSSYFNLWDAFACVRYFSRPVGRCHGKNFQSFILMSFHGVGVWIILFYLMMAQKAITIYSIFVMQ